jgi:hypothetical protein
MAGSYLHKPIKASVAVTTLQLFSTESCSLCEQALDLLLGLPEVAGHTLTVVDISDSEELLSEYSERIPVLKVGQYELNAPFDRDAVLIWLQQANQSQSS